MKKYIDQVIDLTGDSYLNPVGASYSDGSGTHQRSESIITHIAVHHDATVRPHDYDSVARYKQEAAAHYNRLGPGLQYHWKIDNVGQIFKIRPHTTWLYAVGSAANVSTINICLDGYFHPPHNQVPTREQYEALGQLLVFLCEQNPQFPATYPDVWPHCDFSSTACCGGSLIPWVHAIQDKASALNVPSDAVYDWPQLQPAPEQPPVVVTPPPAPPQEAPWVQDNTFRPAKYEAQVFTHLDGLESGKRYAVYQPGHEFDFITRFTKGDVSYLLTQYGLDLHAQGKRELAGIPEKDVIVKSTGTPTPPSPADPNQEPPHVPVPPTPSLEQQTHDKVVENGVKLNAILSILNWIKELLTRIFK